MSISYGNFSQPIQATVSSGLVNGVTDIFFALPWYPASYVERIRIYNSTGSSKNISSVSILSNPAHIRATPTLVDDFLYFDNTTYSVSAATDYSAFYTINPPVYVQELYARSYIYIRVTLATNATNDIYFVNVVGRKAYPVSYNRTDVTGIQKLKDYRVLVGKNQTGSGGTGGVIYSVTGSAIKNGSENSGFLSLASTNDYIYAGASDKVDHWDFVVGTASTNAGALIGQYWNGTDWTNFTTLNNTSSDGTNSMRFSAVVEGAGLGASAWIPTKFDFAANFKLPNDPVTNLEKQIVAGQAPPVGFLYNPPRYWVRFSVASISDTAVISNLFPISEQYGI